MKFKKLVSSFLAGAAVFGAVGVTAFAKDINGDGKTNISDVTALLKKITSKTTVLDDDVNGDGKVNIADATALLKSIVGGGSPQQAAPSCAGDLLGLSVSNIENKYNCTAKASFMEGPLYSNSYCIKVEFVPKNGRKWDFGGYAEIYCADSPEIRKLYDSEYSKNSLDYGGFSVPAGLVSAYPVNNITVTSGCAFSGMSVGISYKDAVKLRRFSFGEIHDEPVNGFCASFTDNGAVSGTLILDDSDSENAPSKSININKIFPR